jgi:hypothetical protein
VADCVVGSGTGVEPATELGVLIRKSMTCSLTPEFFKSMMALAVR